MQALAKLKELGFDFVQLPRYDRHVAATRDGFAALLEYREEHIYQFSSSGYLLDGQLALLVERSGASAFVLKEKQVPASDKMLALYRRFQTDLRSALGL